MLQNLVNCFMRWILGLFMPDRFPPPPGQDDMATMSAVVMHRHGESQELKYVPNYPCPQPNPKSRQVLVDIAATNVNPVDCKLRRGPIADFLLPKPKILGCDFAGLVAWAPSNSEFRVGQRVFGMAPILGSSFGTYAGMIAIEEKYLCRVPNNVKLSEIAAIPLVACTVLSAFKPVIAAYDGNTRNKRCLISAASGGVGTFAVQYCSQVLGMQVTATCSPRNFALLRSLGACKVIDHNTQSIRELADYDVFLDMLGYINEKDVLCNDSKILRRNPNLAESSHYIRVASSPNIYDSNIMSKDPLGMTIPEARIDRVLIGMMKAKLGRLLYHINYHFVLVVPNQQCLCEAAWYLESRKIRAVVQKKMSLHEVSKAHQVVESGHTTGKIVLIVDEEIIAEDEQAVEYDINSGFRNGERKGD